MGINIILSLMAQISSLKPWLTFFIYATMSSLISPPPAHSPPLPRDDPPPSHYQHCRCRRRPLTSSAFNIDRCPHRRRLLPLSAIVVDCCSLCVVGHHCRRRRPPLLSAVVVGRCHCCRRLLPSVVGSHRCGCYHYLPLTSS